MITDPRDRFSAIAESYDRYRPSYPDALIDWLLATAGLAPGDRIADVGCGTGKSARLLAARGYSVIGIDPNAAMLAVARRRGGAEYRQGEATATGLAAASVALLTVGQALHWFDLPAALGEFRRVLVPDGWGAAFWNLREATPAMTAYDRLLREYSTEYGQITRGEDTLAALAATPGLRDFTEAAFPYRQTFDREGLRNRAFSSSYVQHGVGDREGLVRELEALFDRHQVDGRLDFPYQTRVAAWRFPPA